MAGSTDLHDRDRRPCRDRGCLHSQRSLCGAARRSTRRHHDLLQGRARRHRRRAGTRDRIQEISPPLHSGRLQYGRRHALASLHAPASPPATHHPREGTQVSSRDRAWNRDYLGGLAALSRPRASRGLRTPGRGALGHALELSLLAGHPLRRAGRHRRQRQRAETCQQCAPVFLRHRGSLSPGGLPGIGGTWRRPGTM